MEIIVRGMCPLMQPLPYFRTLGPEWVCVIKCRRREFGFQFARCFVVSQPADLPLSTIGTFLCCFRFVVGRFAYTGSLAAYWLVGFDLGRWEVMRPAASQNGRSCCSAALWLNLSARESTRRDTSPPLASAVLIKLAFAMKSGVLSAPLCVLGLPPTPWPARHWWA